MKTTQLASHLARTGAVFALAASAFASSAASAATIEIAFTGLSLVYDGAAIYDGGDTAGGAGDPDDADALTTVDFSVDGVPVNSLTSDVFADVFIPDVVDIPSAANTVEVQTASGSGYFDILIGATPLATEFLRVNLTDVSITYIDVQNIVQFTFGGALSSSFSQNLPFGLEMGGPVTVSFSAQIAPGTRTDNGSEITGFAALGAGVMQGAKVPEPMSFVLAGAGVLAVAGIRRRR